MLFFEKYFIFFLNMAVSILMESPDFDLLNGSKIKKGEKT